MKYRRDIDGLRALAVLPIVLYHAKFSTFSGGFVGVDIFFVISGFLITSIIVRQIEKQEFSLVGFYERRARRILPALIVVLLATMGAAAWLLMPDEYIDLGLSALAAVLFVPNIFYWASTGYFAIEAEATPLLHTWSLGLEEQFYLLYPILLVLLYKKFGKRHVMAILFSLAAVSFVLNVYLVSFKAAFTFYMLPTRAWQLLLGSLMAFEWVPPPETKLGRNLASGTGLLLIIGTIFLLDEAAVFPGVNALAPSLGAALIIYAGMRDEGGWVSRVLASPLPVAVGLISYSLYLWHWPVVVYVNMLEPPWFSGYLVLAMSLGLSVVSYFLVEQPFRKKRLAPSAAQMFVAAGVGGALVALFAVGIHLSNGLAFRLSDEVKNAAREENYLHDDRPCHFIKTATILNKEYCVFGAEDVTPQYAIIGDSHGDALRPALEKAAAVEGVSMIQLTNPGCEPLRGVFKPKARKCLEFIDAAIDAVLENPTIETVFLASYWKVPYHGHSYRHKNYVILDSESVRSTIKDNPMVFMRGLARTVDDLLAAGKRVVILGDPPDLGFNPRAAYARRLHLGLTLPPRFEVAADPGIGEILRQFAASHPSDGVRYVDLVDAVCPGGVCNPIRDNELLYRDGDHLSRHGAELLYGLILDVL